MRTVACCIALAVLVQAAPALGLPGTEPAGPILPCHDSGDAPLLHDEHCALGCDSAPIDDNSVAWATPVRPAEPEPDSTALAAVSHSPIPAKATLTQTWTARAPPPVLRATPVARHDVLLD